LWAWTGKEGKRVILTSPVNDPNYFNTQLQILGGPGLLRRVARTLDLEHNPEFFRLPDAQRRSTWQNLLRMFNLGGQNEAPSVAPPVTYTAADAKSIAPPSPREDQAEAEKLQPYVQYCAGQCIWRIGPGEDMKNMPGPLSLRPGSDKDMQL
jgi:hypothetical protein